MAWPGVQLVISDAHGGGLKHIRPVMLGADWQRCRVYFLCYVLARVARGNAKMIAAATGDRP